SPVQSHILYEIDRQHKPSMQQIAETLGTDITTFSRQVQSLTKMNLVEKTPDPSDRRVYTLSLTVEGKYVATTIDTQMND
ncbi:winged helix-turn-helix transcriptional regulator, partial [Paenibacillus sp. EKM208P]